MKREVLQPETIIKPKGPFSQGIKAENVKGFIFVAGQISMNVSGEVVGVGDIKAQTRQTLENLKAVLASGGANLENILMLRIYTTQIDRISEIHEIRREYFPKDPPAVTTVEVKGLIHKDLLIEIDAVAVT